MKKYIGYAVAALLVLGMFFLLFNNKKTIKEQTVEVSEDNTVVVETVKVADEDYTLEFSANGIISPMKELTYVSDVSGKVIKIFVDKGTKVRRGTPLLEIDKELLQADYEASKAAYESLQKNVDRFISSKQVGGISDQQLESLQTQLIAAKSRYEVSRRRLSDATVKAPMDGIINMRYVEIGSLIAPNAPLFDIVDNSGLKVTCNLPESKINHINKGQSIILTHSSLKGEQFTGRINFIGVKTDRGLNYPVEIILNDNKLLRVGMYMKVNFTSETNHRGILVPRSTIVGGQKSSIVYLMKDGKAVAQDVTLGEMIGDRVEVISGLEEGNVIITSGIMNLSDGTPVKSIN